MEELTIEQKAQRYDEALVWMQDLYPTMEGAMKEDAKHYFPQLKENKSEKIRKILIRFFSNEAEYNGSTYGIPDKDILDWLKKQGNNPTPINIDKMVMKYSQTKDSDFGLPVNCMIRAYRQGIIDVLNLSSGIEKQNEQILANSTKDCKDEQNPTDKIEPKFKVGDTIKCKYDDRQFTIKSVDLDKGTYTYTQEGCGNDIDYADENFELVEQNPADKVKPKFKAGDKIIGIVSGIPYYITEVCNDHYFTETGCCIMFNAQNNFRLLEQKPSDSYCQENCKGFKETGKCFADEDCKAKREAESINKVEPKFHEKDWIVNKDGRIFQIMHIDNDFNHITYACRFIEQDTKDWVSYSEDDISLWDISNAKNGDVLASNCSIFIFSQEYMAGKPEAHCGIMNGFFIVKPKGCWTNEKCYPATKEQRYFLFTKIREAGYEWDADRKELRKIKPKFHKGEWVTNGIETVQITGYDIDYGYQVDYKGNLQHRDTDVIEKEYHLWTIEDAKDGDVLCSGQIILLFKKWKANEWNFAIAYAGIDISGNLQITDEHWLISNTVHPATKEQCDILFQKINEVGYEWDAEKKYLKKIEQKPAWSEEDEKMLDTLIADYEFLSKKYRDQEHDFFVEISLAKDDLDMISWLKSLKERVACEANCTTTKEWSEDEESIINKAESWLDTLCDYLKDSSPEYISDIKDVINRLKSLKDRIGG